MGLYLGKKKLCSYLEKKAVTYSMKMFFDTGGKFQSLSATSIDGWFLYSDTANVTDMSFMFRDCRVLTSVPLFDTSNVASMNSMFSSCCALTSVPNFETSKVTDMGNMFYSCRALTSVPNFDTSKVTDMNSMFSSCSSLTSVPLFDTSNVTSMSYTFYDCSSLTAIHMTGMKVSFDIHWSTKLGHDALVEIIGNLASVTSTQTLTMGSTLLALLSDDEKAVATNKGWTLK